MEMAKGWVPAGLTWEEEEFVVELALVGESPRPPFFAEDLGTDLQTVKVPLCEIDRRGTRKDDGRPHGFVFHMARCGSTLVAQMLSAIDALVLDEPVALQDFLLTAAAVPADKHVQALRHLLQLYVEGLGHDEQFLFIKWSSWAVMHLALLDRAFPNVPCAFIRRDPVEVLVSLVEQRPGWLHTPEITEPLLQLAGPVEGHGGSSDLWLLARCLRGICSLAAKNTGRMLTIDYDQLPAAAWEKLAPHFGLKVTGSIVRNMRQAAWSYSKDIARREFVPDSAAKQARATAEIRAAADKVVVPALETLRTTRRT
jgi:hypothetical protein